MRESEIRAKQKRRFKVTTNSRHNCPVAPNILDREFEVKELDSVWAGDITYVPTAEGWLYLAAVLDLCSRRVVGWAMDTRMTGALAISALNMALAQRTPDVGLLHHSDRGGQYCAAGYRAMLDDHGVTASMSRKGDCWDNAPVESFFGTLKTELINHKRYETRKEAMADTDRVLNCMSVKTGDGHSRKTECSGLHL